MYKSQNVIIILVFLLIGIFTFQSYGISWDEPEQRKIGLVNYNYIFEDDNTLEKWYNRDYGPVFEVILVSVEKIFNISDFRTIYLTRHILIHLLFLFSIYLFYKLIVKIYDNKTLASIGMLLLLLHPRIYGHSFFNSKDIPFLSLIIICIYLFYNIIENRKWYKIVILGIFMGIAINIRIIGIYLPFLFLFYIALLDLNRKRIKDTFSLSLILIVSISMTVFITWPYLWSDTIFHLKSIIKNMSQFRWFGDLLFLGQWIKASEIPWTYLPIWFLLTTPISYVLLGFTGIVTIFYYSVTNYRSIFDKKHLMINILFLLLFFSPIIAIIIFRSALYDGWRHLYFTYPFFVLIAVYGLNSLINTKLKFCIFGILLLSFLRISYFYLANFPLQHVYYNDLSRILISDPVEDNFDMDYWGLSYKQALEYLDNEIDTEAVKVHFKNTPGELNLEFLPKDIKSKFVLVPFENADFYVSNFRQKDSLFTKSNSSLYYTIKVGNNTINKIYHLKN